MTPLAQAFTKQFTLPMRKRWDFHQKNAVRLKSALADIHCFELTQAWPMLESLEEIQKRDADAIAKMGKLMFLPAPKTWIEWSLSGERWAFLCEQVAGEAKAHVTHFMGPPEPVAQNLGWISLDSDEFFRGDPSQQSLSFFLPASMQASGIPPLQLLEGMLSCVQGCLILINSPKIIGRSQHAPHRALERRLLSEFGAGQFPVHAWTEIKLQVSKPTKIDDGEPHEAHLTGSKALHFVRKHIRIRRGQLEYVSAHWRGDAAIGIKQSRYMVTR